MSQVHQKGRVTPSMNITPLIDVVFLLIVFFMLVSNIAADERVDMAVPDLDNPELKQIEEGTRLIVNIVASVEKDKRGTDMLDIGGEAKGVKVGANPLILMAQMGSVVDAIKEDVDKNPEIEILVRADAAIYFEDVQRVLKAIAEAGGKNVRFTAKEEL